MKFDVSATSYNTELTKSINHTCIETRVFENSHRLKIESYDSLNE
jgi:hypothetical protein